jgi:hypothetical protein
MPESMLYMWQWFNDIWRYSDKKLQDVECYFRMKNIELTPRRAETIMKLIEVFDGS